MEILVLGGDLVVKDDQGQELRLDRQRRKEGPRQFLGVLACDLMPTAADLKWLLYGDQAWLWCDKANLTSRLTTLINQTRGLVPKEWVLTERSKAPSRYRLRRDPGDTTDVDRFHAALRLAERAQRNGDQRTAIRYYDEALRQWRAHQATRPLPDRTDGTDSTPDLLPDLPHTPRMNDVRQRLIGLLHMAIETSTELHLEVGDHSLALADRIGDLMAAFAPDNTQLLYLRMLTLYRAHRKKEALALYDAEAKTPGPKLDRLHAQIIADDPLLQWVPPAAVLTVRTLPEGSRPTVRGVYDAAENGKEHYQPDRELLRRVLNRKSRGGFPTAVRASRRCRDQMLGTIVGAGVRQIIDLGCGIPVSGHPSALDLAVKAASATSAHDSGGGNEVRVLYVDNDPVVAAHIRALETDHRSAALCEADLRDTDRVLYEARQHLDLRRPVAVVATNVLAHLGRATADLGTADLAETLRTYMTAFAAGSMLAITHLTGEGLPRGLRCHLDATGPDPDLPHYLRSAAQVRALFGDLPLTPPGLVDAATGQSVPHPPPRRVVFLAGLAAVPSARQIPPAATRMRTGITCTTPARRPGPLRSPDAVTPSLTSPLLGSHHRIPQGGTPRREQA